MSDDDPRVDCSYRVWTYRGGLSRALSSNGNGMQTVDLKDCTADAYGALCRHLQADLRLVERD